MANSIDLNQVSYCLVTGASRGIGQKMAIECSKKFKAGSVVVLLARSITGLEKTKSLILEENSQISVVIHSIDLTAPSKKELNEIITKSMSCLIFELAFIIHNFGTTGDLSKTASKMNDMTEWHSYFSANVFSVAGLNCQFMENFPTTKKLIVNITSKMALFSAGSMTLYCSGKAAREMYFRVLADEQPEILVLNYSPGPVETDMSANVEATTSDQSVKEFFKGIRANNTILTTDQTTAKFIEILEKGDYKSGDHVGYYLD